MRDYCAIIARFYFLCYTGGMFNPHYTLTDSLVQMLTSIAESKEIIARAKILPQQELKLKRQALARMTHSSTAIEGNKLNLNEVGALLSHKKVDAPQREIYEVQNYLKALRYIEKTAFEGRLMTEKVVREVHALVTSRTIPKEQCGRYRQGLVYVVKKRAGSPDEVVYTGPPAKEVSDLCRDLLAWMAQSEQKEVNPVIAAGIVHQEIAAIHPFTDGNGRTARAMATYALYRRGYDFRRLFALEDYYNRDRQAYYEAIDLGKNYAERKTDFTPWLIYFTQGFKEEIDAVKRRVISLSGKKVSDAARAQVFLPQEQIEILDVLDREERITAERAAAALKCPKRTAQLHLQKLKKLGMLVQTGKGPASAYQKS